VLIHLRQWENSITIARDAEALSRKLTAEYPSEHSYRNKLRHALGQLGVPLEQLGRHAEAETAFREALTIAEHLVAAQYLLPNLKRAEAVHCDSLAGVLSKSGQTEASERYRQRALEIHAQLAEQFPDDSAHLHSLAHSRLLRGISLRDKGQIQDAEKEFAAAIRHCSKTVVDFPNTTQFRASLAEMQEHLATLLKNTSRVEEAQDYFGQALENRIQLVAQAPSRPNYQSHLSQTFHLYVDPLLATGRTEQAEAAYRKYLKLLDKLATDDPTNVSLVHAGDQVALILARVMQDHAGQPVRAEAVCRERIALLQDSPDLRQPHEHLRQHGYLQLILGRSLASQKRFAEAAEALSQSAEAWEQMVRLPEAATADREALERAFVHLRRAEASATEQDTSPAPQPKRHDSPLTK
jgi:tetratricopeptide (TPR) repeat protein